jgi:hypothetical protein
MDYLREQYPRPWFPREPPPERGPADWRFVAGLAVGLLLLALGFGFGLIAANARPSGGATVGGVGATQTASMTPLATASVTTAASATATSATTPGATPTATGPAGVITGAYLGGTQDAFTAAYGDPTMPYNVAVYAVLQTDGTNAAASLYGFVAGTDGLQRVDNLAFALNPNNTWTADANYQAARVLFPPDAVFVEDVQDQTLGTVHIYRSASLAASLPASAFANTQGGPTWPPGTFSVACNAPGVQQCTIVTGT